MNISETGKNLIKKYEGCRLTAYKCVSTETYYTIGWGHYGKDVTVGMTITQAQADSLFDTDIQKYVNYVNAVNDSRTEKFNQNQFDALCSFCYNCGNGSLKKLCADRTNSVISEKITAYNKSGGKVLQGLVKRRAEEKALFDKGVSRETSTTIDYIQIAKDVIKGVYGNGSRRKQLLSLKGYDYATVQSYVNKILKGEIS